jgi:hypothetical protein
MTTAPTKKKSKEEDKDNIFMEFLYNVLIQLPTMVVVWIISKFSWD